MPKLDVGKAKVISSEIGISCQNPVSDYQLFLYRCKRRCNDREITLRRGGAYKGPKYI